jgi:hypothetical protein
MDFVHVSVRGCVGTVGVDVDGTAHPGVLAVRVLLYVEVHGACGRGCALHYYLQYNAGYLLQYDYNGQY